MPFYDRKCKSLSNARSTGSDTVSVKILCRAQDAVGGNRLGAAENAANGVYGLEDSSRGHFCALVLICKFAECFGDSQRGNSCQIKTPSLTVASSELPANMVGAI